MRRNRFRCLVAAMMLVVATLGPALAADDDTPYNRAFAAFKARHYQEAIGLLGPVLAANPRDARALVLRGDCKAQMTDNQGALQDYNDAIAIAPDYQYAYVTRCETRLQLDNSTGALEDCNTAIRLDPKDALAYEDRGDVYFDREAYDLALPDYDKAIELGRSGAYVYAARCDTERLVGKRDRASADCETALRLDPKSRRGLWAQARLAIVNGRYAAGIGDLNAYIGQQSTKSTTAYYFRGLAYNRMQNYRLALEDLQTYVGREPSDPDGFRERGLARSGLGDAIGAMTDLTAALSGYRKSGNAAAADRVVEMQKALRAGQPLPVPQI